MNKYKVLIIFALTFILFSCATERHKYKSMSSKDVEKYEIIGIVETSFEATVNTNTQFLQEKSYNELLTFARSKYDGDIDVMNIVLEKEFSKKNLWYIFPEVIAVAITGVIPTVVHFVTVNTKGVVVKIAE